MTTASTIAINDGVASLNYEPDQYAADKSSIAYIAQTDLPPIGWRVLLLKLVRPSAPKAGDASRNRVYRANIHLDIPVLEQNTFAGDSGLEPPPTVAFISRVKLEAILPERATSAQRAVVLASLVSALGNVQVTETISKLRIPM